MPLHSRLQAANCVDNPACLHTSAPATMATEGVIVLQPGSGPRLAAPHMGSAQALTALRRLPAIKASGHIWEEGIHVLACNVACVRLRPELSGWCGGLGRCRQAVTCCKLY